MLAAALRAFAALLQYLRADMPALPVLTSLQRLTLDGTPGVWMDDADAGRLAVWIRDVTGETGQ